MEQTEQTHLLQKESSNPRRENDPEGGYRSLDTIPEVDSEAEMSSSSARCLTDRQIAWIKILLGYLLVIFAGLAFTGANVLQKLVAPTLNFWHLLCYRGIIQMICMGLVITLSKTSLTGPFENRARVFFQGFLGGTLLLSIFVAIKHVPLGNASAIFFCTPVFTFFFAIFMLDEDMGIYRCTISALMVIGVVLITRPPLFFGHDVVPPGTNVEESFSTLGYFCAVLVPLLSAILSILTRQLKHINPAVLMFWLAAGACIVACGGIVLTQSGDMFDLDAHDWACAFGIIFLGIIGNLSYTLAVRWVSPTKANVFRSFEVVLNFALQISLEHMIFHYVSIVGIVFLLLAVVLTGFESEVFRKYSHRYRLL